MAPSHLSKYKAITLEKSIPHPARAAKVEAVQQITASKKIQCQRKDHSHVKYTKDINLDKIRNKLNKSLIHDTITPKPKGIIDLNSFKEED